MKFNRILAVILRYLFFFRKSLDRLVDAFYWPALDLLLWGITSLYFTKTISDASSFIVLIVSGIVFWIIVYRGQYEISGNLLEDLWNRNLVNMFVAPLKFSEWISAFLILGVIKATLSFSFAIFLAFILYNVRVFSYGFYILPFVLLLILTGWTMGFLIAGLILRFGTKIQAFAWTVVWVIAPFSAIYYPLSTLPDWAQKISLLVPTSYVFEGIREVIQKGTIDPNKIIVSFVLNILYLILSLFFLKKSFNKVLEKGLIRLY